jgi:hypothetical protein
MEPGAQSTFEELDAISRTRPLTDAETERLEWALERLGERKGQQRHWTYNELCRLRSQLLNGKRPKDMPAIFPGRTERAMWRVMTILGWTVGLAKLGYLPCPPRDLSGWRRKSSIPRASEFGHGG